jgi:phospholipid/cholesterol/gamma-HCH transport system ATP-binding protein
MTTQNNTPVIEFKDVSKRFNDEQFVVLDHMNLTIKPRHIHVLIGFSGTGKSVTIRHALGLMKPDSGQVFVQGENLAKLSDFELREIRKNFGMLFQSVA